MDMGCASEVDDRRRTFDSPDIPNSIIEQVAMGEVGETQLIQTAVLLNQVHGFRRIFIAIHTQDRSQSLLEEARGSSSTRRRQPEELALDPWMSTEFSAGGLPLIRACFLCSTITNRRRAALSRFGSKTLLFGRGFLAVPVDDRATKGHFVLSVAVGRSVRWASGQHPFETFVARFANQAML